MELAGVIGEIAHHTLPREFRIIDPHQTRIILIDGGPRVLVTFPESLSQSASRDLTRLGVEIRTNTRVTRIDPSSIWLGDEQLEADTVLWAAGVTASPISRTLGVPIDGGGRIIVESDMTIPGHPEVFVIGDLAAATDGAGTPLPGTAPVAIQAAQATAAKLLCLIDGDPIQPFVYRDRG